MCTFDEVLVQPIGSFLEDNSRRPFPLSLAENVEKVKVTLWSRLMINKMFPYMQINSLKPGAVPSGKISIDGIRHHFFIVLP